MLKLDLASEFSACRDIWRRNETIKELDKRIGRPRAV